MKFLVVGQIALSELHLLLEIDDEHVAAILIRNLGELQQGGPVEVFQLVDVIFVFRHDVQLLVLVLRHQRLHLFLCIVRKMNNECSASQKKNN